MSESIDPVLSRFGECALALKALLEHKANLTHIEQMYLENRITMIQLAYQTWRRTNK
jgi:predicted amino acid-binding ACT domain protein